MSKLDQTKDILNNSRAQLKTLKSEVVALLKDPKVADWQGIDLEKNSAPLKALEIVSTDLKKAMANYSRVAKEISKQLKSYNNLIGNQLADMLGKTDQDQMLVQAQALEKKCAGMEQLKEELLTQTDVLVNADRQLRECLNVHRLLKLTQIQDNIKKGLFTKSLEIFHLISPDPAQSDGGKTINDYQKQTVKLEARFQHLDLPRMPRLAEEIVFHFFKLGADSVKDILAFINTLNGRLTGEFHTLSQINKNLDLLREEGTANLIKGLVTQARSLGSLICGFYHKRQLKGNLSTIEETLEFLNIYHLALKNKIITEIKQGIEDPLSPVNPAPLAEKQTKAFFIGAAGLIRSVKLMVTSLSGKEAINQVELQLILEKAVNTCKIYYGTSDQDLQQLRIFIDHLIKHFDKPFPYNDLQKLTKAAIATYGQEVENFIKNYDIKRDFQVVSNVPLPSTMGKLYTILKEKKRGFNEANKQGAK